jgi:hypothetical protein
MSTLQQIKQKVTKKAFHKKESAIISNKTYSEGKESFQLMGLLTELLKLKKKQAKESISFISSVAESLRLQGILKTPPFLLKPSSTVAGFKKAMYNSVKYGQNQLQPGYNRRKFNYSHYNQTIKENTRLSKLYAYLSTAQLENYRAFTGLNKSSDFSAKLKNLNNNYSQHGETLKSLLDRVCNKTNNTQETPKRLPFVVPHEPLCLNFSFLEGVLLGKGEAKEIKDTHLDYTAQKLNRHLKSPRTIPKLVNFLESRLDVILWRSLFSESIVSSRQRLREGILVNGGTQKKASFLTLPADVITFTK